MNELPDTFLTRAESKAQRRTQTMDERGVWGRYFAKYGCLVCGDSIRTHQGKGFCSSCYRRTWDRLRAIEAAIEAELREGMDRNVNSAPFHSLAQSKKHGFVTRPIACQILGLNVKTVMGWMRLGYFPPPEFTFSGHDLWSIADIERLRLFAQYRLKRPVRYKHPELIEREIEREISRRLK